MRRIGSSVLAVLVGLVPAAALATIPHGGAAPVTLDAGHDADLLLAKKKKKSKKAPKPKKGKKGKGAATEAAPAPAAPAATSSSAKKKSPEPVRIRGAEATSAVL